MDCSALLTTLWNKVSKPLPNLFIGAVFLSFAPDNIQWFGYIFCAIGAAAGIEWICAHIQNFKKKSDANKQIENTLSCLNHGERKVIGQMLNDNEQTISINYNDYHMNFRGGCNGQRGGRYEYTELFGICTGLQSKGLFTTASLEEITSFSFFPEVWEIMQKLHHKKPELFQVGSDE